MHPESVEAFIVNAMQVQDYNVFRSGQFTYAVNWKTVYDLIHRYWIARTRASVARVVSASEGLADLVLPRIEHLEIDWDRVRREATQRADMDFERLALMSESQIRLMYEQLRDMVDGTADATEELARKMRALQAGNAVRIESNIQRLGNAKWVFEILRDVSAETMAVGATVLTGGAAGPALATLAGASTLKGIGKFEDSGNIGAAVMTAAGSLAFGLFKVGGQKLDATGDFVLAIVQAQWDTANAMIEGKSLEESVAKGATKFAGLYIDKFTKLDRVKRLLEKVPVPLYVASAGESELSRKLASKALQKGADYQGKKAVLTAMASRAPKPETGPEPKPQGGGLIASATFNGQFLLHTGMINLDVGVRFR